MWRKYIPILGKSALSGIIISIACCAYLLTDNRYVGGVLFSFALYCIIRFGFALFTGKVGYIPDNGAGYLIDVAAAFIGNIFGVSCAAALLSASGIWERISAEALALISVKLSHSLLSAGILGFFCGFLVYFAIENSLICTVRDCDTSLIFGTVMPVMLFIFCGFNHCIADSFYLAASGLLPDGIVYIIIVAVGNSLGAMLVPLAKKLYSFVNKGNTA